MKNIRELMSDLFGRKENVKAVTILLFLASFLLLLFGYYLYRPLFLCDKICGEIADIRPGYVRWKSRRTSSSPTTETQIISCIDKERGLVDFFYINYLDDDKIQNFHVRQEIEAYCMKSIVSCQTDWSRITEPKHLYKVYKNKNAEYTINYRHSTEIETNNMKTSGTLFLTYKQSNYILFWTISIIISALSIVCLLYLRLKWPMLPSKKTCDKNPSQYHQG